MPEGRKNNRYAVLVGISHQYGVKINGDNNARLMKKILREAGYPMSSITLMTNRQATKQAFVDAVEKIKSVEDEETTIVIFIACHGSNRVLMFIDAAMSSVQLGEILSFRSQKQVVLITACYSGSVIPDIEANNRLVITATSAYTVDPVTHRYTRWAEAFLLAGILEKEADTNGDGQVSMQEARYYSGGRMSDNYGEEFYL